MENEPIVIYRRRATIVGNTGIDSRAIECVFDRRGESRRICDTNFTCAVTCLISGDGILTVITDS